MPSDRSRVIDHPAHGYIAPVAQQGRVILDRDFNAWQAYLGARIDADALDFVGPCGTPDDGFRISLPPASPPGAVWSPPAPESPPNDIGQGSDFLIAGGTMYLGGLRVCWPTLQNGKGISYSYADQPELPPPASGFVTEIFHHYAQELVYLDVTLQEVSATEDPDLLDVALGGPDTTQRLKQRVRVERQGMNADGCATAWAQMLTVWAGEGLVFDPDTMSLTPAVKLKVGFTQDASTGDPCDPVASGGYLGADNQLIRVRVAGDVLAWGYDNASFIYRIASIGADRKTLTLAGAPPDALHYPQAGQVVEILATSAVIGEEPDVSGTPGAPPMIRVSAQANGTLCKLAQPYGPSVQGDPTNYIVLDKALPAGITASDLPVFLRVWQAQLPLVLGKPIVLEDPATGITTGIEVTLSGAKVAADGAFWQIAARPATPQGVYPEELLTAPQPANGPLRLVCPLAVISWGVEGDPSIADCRNSFDNLVTLSRRKPGCCSIPVSPADLVGRVTLQTLIDGAVAQAPAAKICLARGVYLLTEPLRLDFTHHNLTIECCGGVAQLRMAPGADASRFASGLIGLYDAFDVTLSGLTLVPPIVPFSAALLASLTSRLANDKARVRVRGALRSPSSCIGIHAWNGVGLTVQQCNISFPAADTARLDLVAAGLFLQGNCTNLAVQDCNFSSMPAPTYNPIFQAKDYLNLIPAERVNFMAPALSAALEKTAAPVLRDVAPTVQGGAAPAPAPAPSPVPGAFNAAQEIFSGAALAKLAASRDSGSFISLQRPMIASCGILAMTYGVPAAESKARGNDFSAGLTVCAFDNALIAGNNFSKLTIATLMVANGGVLRVQDNNVSASAAGFWIALSDPVSPDNALDGTDQYYDSVTEFEEFQALFAVSSILPPPEPFAGLTRARMKQEAIVVPVGLTATYMVSNNQILTGPHPPPAPGTTREPGAIIGSSALLLWLDADTGQDSPFLGNISALVTGNQMLTGAANVPSALFVLADGQPCAVNGNVILNEPGNIDVLKPSLWAVISNSAQNTQPFAASGNVLRGASDISYFNRTGAATRGGWSGYNADPF